MSIVYEALRRKQEEKKQKEREREIQKTHERELKHARDSGCCVIL